MNDILDTLILVLIWIANGGLVVVFWLIDHVLLLAAIPAFYLLVVQARREQRIYALAAGGLSLLASLLVPPPIPLIILVMAWAGVVAVKVDRFNPGSLRWRVVGGLALYAVAALGWTAYSAYVANLSAEQWGALFAADEAAATIAQGRSFLSTISVWGLWIIVPLGYFSLLLQGIFVHAPLAASPEKIIQTVRARGEAAPEGENARHPSWLPFVQR
ncbi:MAG: hypothetical protein ACK2US_05805 [Anaerolineae bacterium]|jgi:hypothetical protein